MLKQFIKSIFAGLCIGIACLVSLGAGGGVPGALLFSVGLFFIVIRKYNLYTGKVGYISKRKDIFAVILFLVGNLVGCWLISLVATYNATALVAAKLSQPLLLTFGKAIGCGFLMYLAVDIYKKNKSVLGVLAGVPAFILAGFEHSIADACYIFIAGCYTWQTLLFLVVVIIGNALGALAHRLVE